MTVPTPTSCDLRLPAERFYWAVLDIGRLPTSRTRRATQLDYLFESVLPVSIETVHATYRPLGDDRVLACGMPADTLVAAASPDLTALGPGALPEFVGDLIGDAVRPTDLNLLTGAHEPSAIRLARQRATLAACVLFVIATGLLVTGQQRRAHRLHQQRDLGVAAISSIYDQVLGPAGGSLPQDARLLAELRMLDRTRGPRPATAGPAEIAPHLGALLASWPAGLHITTEQLTAGPSLLTVNAMLPDQVSAERFEQELRPPPGWSMAQPSIQSERGEIAVRVRMEPEGTP